VTSQLSFDFSAPFGKKRHKNSGSVLSSRTGCHSVTYTIDHSTTVRHVNLIVHQKTFTRAGHTPGNDSG
jgi:hypothetical protein